MKSIYINLALSAGAMALTQPAIAQDRTNLSDMHAPSSVSQRGAAVMASVKIALGGPRNTPSSQTPVRFDLVAGPSFQLSDGQPLQRTKTINGGGFRLSFIPNHSTKLSLNGQPLATHYFNLSAAESDEKKVGGGGPSTLAIVGGVLVLGLGVAYLALEDAVDCNENGQYICE
jgi:hypothetical protein